MNKARPNTKGQLLILIFKIKKMKKNENTVEKAQGLAKAFFKNLEVNFFIPIYLTLLNSFSILFEQQ